MERRISVSREARSRSRATPGLSPSMGTGRAPSCRRGRGGSGHCSPSAAPGRRRRRRFDAGRGFANSRSPRDGPSPRRSPRGRAGRGCSGSCSRRSWPAPCRSPSCPPMLSPSKFLRLPKWASPASLTACRTARGGPVPCSLSGAPGRCRPPVCSRGPSCRLELRRDFPKPAPKPPARWRQLRHLRPILAHPTDTLPPGSSRGWFGFGPLHAGRVSGILTFAPGMPGRRSHASPDARGAVGVGRVPGGRECDRRRSGDHSRPNTRSNAQHPRTWGRVSGGGRGWRYRCSPRLRVRPRGRQYPQGLVRLTVSRGLRKRFAQFPIPFEKHTTKVSRPHPPAWGGTRGGRGCPRPHAVHLTLWHLRCEGTNHTRHGSRHMYQQRPSPDVGEGRWCDRSAIRPDAGDRLPVNQSVSEILGSLHGNQCVHVSVMTPYPAQCREANSRCFLGVRCGVCPRHDVAAPQRTIADGLTLAIHSISFIFALLPPRYWVAVIHGIGLGGGTEGEAAAPRAGATSPRARRASRVSPWRNPIAMKGTPPSSSTWWMVATWSCLTAAIASASRMNRMRRGAGGYRRQHRLEGDAALQPGVFGPKTTPMPRWPRIFRMRYLPSRPNSSGKGSRSGRGTRPACRPPG